MWRREHISGTISPTWCIYPHHMGRIVSKRICKDCVGGTSFLGPRGDLQVTAQVLESVQIAGALAAGSKCQEVVVKVM